jgi:prepilin-type N-terminal cleavage/methylation domain-containing protein
LQFGFTLIELLIVIIIIAGVFAVFAPSLFSKSDRQVRKEVRRISLLSKEVRNRALLTKNTHRIVFNMNKDSVTFEVEEASGKILLDTPEERLKFINGKKNFTETELEEYQRTNPFKKVDRFSKNGPLKMPDELMIKQIELQGIKEAFKEGEVEIYFMPEGFVELAVIQVQTKDEALKWTLVTSPLTGLMDMFEGHLSMETIEDRD